MPQNTSVSSGDEPASAANSPANKPAKRATFGGRSMFIFAAIGSAIGLGNICLFPYVIALLTAGVPVLILDYVLGHRFRGSAPLVWRRISRKTEAIGWVQTGITYIIAVYYCVILAWAAMYTWFSLKLAWGQDPEKFFTGDFLHADTTSLTSANVVWPIAIVLALVWAAITAVMVLGVRKGTGLLSSIFVPLLIIMFIILVIRALFLPGAAEGLEAFFTPQWGALLDPQVWIAAYGQIFYSLAIAFGIMMTQASYLQKRANLSGLGAVVGLSNSAFEVLAGIGVFATLGFMAVTQHVAVADVATNGIGLAFYRLPDDHQQHDRRPDLRHPVLRLPLYRGLYLAGHHRGSCFVLGAGKIRTLPTSRCRLCLCGLRGPVARVFPSVDGPCHAGYRR